MSEGNHLNMALAKRERALVRNGKGSLGKAADDEPVFILRGQDRLAPILVELWAELARSHGCPSGKVREARSMATAMRRWPKRKYPD
jgi:hypothetical protein